MKRTIKQAFIFSAIIHGLFLLGTIALGYIRTSYYVPDIVNAYQSVDYLQNEVAFGVSTPLSTLPFLIVSLLLVSVVFITFKTILVKRIPDR
jgi:menaquinol-cytochrome c reductase cytochrome b subunit